MRVALILVVNVLNVCYADDILIISTAVTGLQKMLNAAVQYVSDHGLRLNPSETVGMVKSNDPFVSLPKLFLNTLDRSR